MGSSPKTITYSMLDLYLMGLADPAEVTPFGVLENVTPPADIKDPFSKGTKPYDASSFPWFGGKPFTARPRVARSPSRTSSPPTAPAFPQGRRQDEPRHRAAGEGHGDGGRGRGARSEVRAHRRHARARYHEATHERGTLTNVTLTDVTITPDAGADVDAGTSDPPAAAAGADDSSGGCSTSPTTPGSLAFLAGLFAAAFVARRRRAPHA